MAGWDFFNLPPKGPWPMTGGVEGVKESGRNEWGKMERK
jgi:hypothetical protein